MQFHLEYFSLLSGRQDRELNNGDSLDIWGWMATLVMKNEKIKRKDWLWK